MITVYQTNNSKCAQKCIMQAIARTNQSNLDVRHVILVPDRASFEAERALLATLGGSFNTEVLTFRRLANRFLPEHRYLSKQSAIIALTKIIADLQGLFVCYKKGTSQTGFVESMYEAVSQFKYCNVKPEDLFDEALPNPLKSKLHDIGLIYQAYQDFLKDRYVDSSDKLALLYQQLEKPNQIDNCYFYLYDFDNFSAQEYSLIKQFALKSKGVTVACPTSFEDRDKHLFLNEVYNGLEVLARQIGQQLNVICQTYHENQATKQIGDNLYRYDVAVPIDNNNFIQVFQGNTRLQEVYALACQIQRYVRNGGKFGDVYVVTSDVNKYKNVVRTVFDEFEIPYFCDVKTTLDSHVFSQYLLDYLQMVKANFSLKSVLSFVKNPLFSFGDNNVFMFENYCLKYNVDYYFDKPFTLGVNEPTFVAAQTVREQLQAVTSAHAFANVNRVNDYVNQLKQMILDLSLEEKCLNLAKLQEESNLDLHAKTTQQVAEKFVDVLNQMEEMLQDAPLPLDQFVKILTTALQSVNVSVLPQKTDSVVVVNMAKSRKHDVGFLALLGANNSVMPIVKGDNKMLTDANVTQMAQYGIPKVIQYGIPKIEVENKRERFALLQLLQEPSQKLFVGYCNMDGSTVLSPSTFIDQLYNLFTVKDEKGNSKPLSKMDSADEEVYTKAQALSKLVLARRRQLDKQPVRMSYYNVLYQHFKEEVESYSYLKDGNVNINNGKQLFLQDSSVSVSKITDFYNCPYSFYFRYGLEVKKREIAELKSNDLGEILHEVLQYYVVDADVSETDEQTATKAKALFDTILQKDFYKALQSDPSMKNTLKQLREESAKLCNTVKGQIATSKFTCFKTELYFGKGKYKPVEVNFGEHKFLLKGKIDRVDVNGANFIVIDYKSGGSSGSTFTENELYVGKKLQLLVYLKAIVDNLHLNPVGFYYFNIHDKFVKKGDRNIDFYSGRTLDDKEIIQQIDTNFANGKSTRLNVSIRKKDNCFSEKSQVITARQLDAEINYAMTLIANAGKLMSSGYVSTRPYVKACDYCDYATCCDYKDVFTYSERKAPKVTPQDIEVIDANKTNN